MAPIASRGLIVGKFLPPTAGHAHLIAAGREAVDHLTVLVCSLAREPIPGSLRVQWLKEMTPGAEVVHCADELPSYPEDHPDFWRLWREAIQRHVPAVDLLISSEDYGDRLAAEIGARHLLVDRARSAVPVSATRVRADPFLNWDFLPAPVRAHYVLRVAVVGPESTGKTTLAEALARHYGTVWVPEFAREYVDRIGGLDRLSYDDIEAIAAGQAAAEDLAAREANRLLFSDTDVMTTAIYAMHYFGRCPERVVTLSHARRFALHLLTDIDLPWIDDPQRDQPHRRKELLDRFQGELELRGLPFVRITGTGDARARSAIEAIDALVSSTGTSWQPS